MQNIKKDLSPYFCPYLKTVVSWNANAQVSHERHEEESRRRGEALVFTGKSLICFVGHLNDC